MADLTGSKSSTAEVLPPISDGVLLRRRAWQRPTLVRLNSMDTQGKYTFSTNEFGYTKGS